MPETPTIFDPASLQRHIDAVFAEVPVDHHTALVGYYTTDGRWRMTVARRVGNSWFYGATFGKDQAAGNIAGGVFVRGSW